MRTSLNGKEKELKKKKKRRRSSNPAGQGGSTIIVLWMSDGYKNTSLCGQRDVKILTGFQCIYEDPNNILVSIITI